MFLRTPSYKKKDDRGPPQRQSSLESFSSGNEKLYTTHLGVGVVVDPRTLFVSGGSGETLDNLVLDVKLF